MNDDSNPIGRVISGPVAPLERAAAAWREQPVGWDRMAEAKPYAVRREQTTIERPVTVRGRGTFFGKSIRTLTFCPTDAEGWWFERTDLPDSLPVRCSIRNVWTTGSIVSNIVLRSGSPHNYIRMAEHMIALRMGLGIDNLRIRIDSGDPPLFDRGSKELVDALNSAGRRRAGRPVPYVTVREKVTVSNGHGGFLTLVPAEAGNPALELDVALAFKTAIGQQRIRFAVDPEIFAYGATARTNASAGTVLFCRTLGWMFADVRNLGYTFENLLVAGRWRYWNQALLEHDGKSLEAAWHRACLDLLAAIALIDDGLFVGKNISYQSGHGLDVEMVQRLYQESLLTPIAPA